VRNASTRATLFEQDHAISLRVEEASVVVDQTRAWTTVQKHDGFTVRVAALLVIKLVNVGDWKMSAIVGFDGIVQSS